MTNQLTKILGFNLRKMLKEAGVSQAFLAKRIKRVPLTVFNYLSGRTTPDLKTANRIRAEFGYEPLKELPKTKARRGIEIAPAKKTTKAAFKAVQGKDGVFHAVRVEAAKTVAEMEKAPRAQEKVTKKISATKI